MLRRSARIAKLVSSNASLDPLDARLTLTRISKRRGKRKEADPGESSSSALNASTSEAQLSSPPLSPVSSPPSPPPSAPTPVTNPLVPPPSISSLSGSFKSSARSSPPSPLFLLSLRHILTIDPSLRSLTAAYPACPHLSPPKPLIFNAFEALASSIISQQISGAAAKSVRIRFVRLFRTQVEPTADGYGSNATNGSYPTAERINSVSTENSKVAATGTGFTDLPASEPGDLVDEWGIDGTSSLSGRSDPFPTPSQVLAAPPELLRTAGLTNRKVEYLIDLARHFVDGRLSDKLFLEGDGRNSNSEGGSQTSPAVALETVDHAVGGDGESKPYFSSHRGDDEEMLLSQLTAVKGIGRWSAQMFAFFALGRPNVFATGDLGVQKGVAIYLGKNIKDRKVGKGKWKYCSEQEMLAAANKFAPYRSLFMWYMWKLVNTEISVLSKDDPI